jgi:putative ABC transport system permease protein
MLSITLGVGALVAIHSFRDDVARSVTEQARVLLGADARIGASRPLPDTLASIVDSLAAAGARSARVTTAASMVLAPRSDRVRLLQVRAVDGGWPFYGGVVTTPAGRWADLGTPGEALVDPAVLVQLDVSVGDTLAVGRSRVRIAATVDDLPTDIGFQAAVGPRVWISEDQLRDAGLLGFGSLARYETYLRLPAEDDAGAVWTRYESTFRGAGFGYTTADEQARDLTDALDFLARYLGLVGLGALLLGGVGVASAIHAWVKEKLTGVAVLRCIGARQGTVFRAYLLQAAVLGAAGALLGVGVGLATQRLLPVLLAGALPVQVVPRISVRTVAGGLGIGLLVSLLFALGPLLDVRDVPPLRALRRDVEEGGRRRPDAWRMGIYLLIAVAVAGSAALEAPSPAEGLAFTAALLAVAGALRGTAWLVTAAARRFLPRRASYPLRQGVSNLFRPRNQTVTLTFALGFGVFVVATVLQVESSLLEQLDFEGAAGRPNLLLFDIQPDQVEGVVDLLPAGAREGADVTPIVPGRITAIGGRSPSELRADTSGSRPSGWALRRQYRNTYRETLTDTEELVEGEWFDDPGSGAPGAGTADAPARISLEADVARDLRVGVGDTITWDVGGRPVTSVVTSLRRVEWDRFATNFFVVFEPGILEDAPGSAVALARIPTTEGVASFQRDLVEAYPNVSVLDLARVQETVDTILGHVDRAVRFLALFSAAAGLVVLAGALATSRHQRIQEGALLRTLGARRGQVVSVLLAEFAGLASLVTVAGLGLAVVASAALVRGVFGIPFAPSLPALAVVWGGVTILTVLVGMVGSRGVLARPPLPVLREAAE